MKKIIIIVIAVSMCIGNIAFAQEDEPAEWASDIINELNSKDLLRIESFKNYQENISRGEFIYLAVRLYEIIKDEEIVVDENIQFTEREYYLVR